MWDTITFIGPRLAIASMIRMRRRRPSSVQCSLIWPGSSRGRSSVRMSSQASASRIAAPTMYSWCFSLSTQLDSSRKDFRSPAPGVVVTAPRYWELPTSTALSEQLLHTFGCASTTSPVGPVAREETLQCPGSRCRGHRATVLGAPDINGAIRAAPAHVRLRKYHFPRRPRRYTDQGNNAGGACEQLRVHPSAVAGALRPLPARGVLCALRPDRRRLHRPHRRREDRQ